MFRLRPWIGDRKNVLKRLGVFFLVLIALTFGATAWRVIRPPIEPRTSALLVNDVSQLNPIVVGRVITPTTTAEIVTAV